MCVGGNNKNKDVRAIRVTTPIVVSTPGRLMDHLLNINLSQRMANLNVLILDAQSCAAIACDILAGKSDSGPFSHNVKGDQYFAMQDYCFLYHCASHRIHGEDNPFGIRQDGLQCPRDPLS